MIYVKLAAPIILTAQIPEIAEILGVEKELLWKLVSFSTYAYAEKNGKRNIVALPNPAADFTEAVAKYDKVYYGAEAALKMAKDKGVKITALNRIELGADVFEKTTPAQFKDISLMTANIERLSTRIGRLAALNAPDVIYINECRLLRRYVQALENNRGFSSPAKATDGHVLYSLNDIGYSLITGWDVSAAKAKDDKQVDSSGFNAQYMAKLVRRAMGTKSQEKFAFEAGLSRSYIASLLSGNAKSQPTENTIRKLANATDMVTEDEFRVACGYDELTKDKNKVVSKFRAHMDDAAWQRCNIEWFLSFLKETIPMAIPFTSTDILLNLFESKYGDKDDQFTLEKVSVPFEYHVDGSAANVILPLRLRWFNLKRMIVQTLYVGLLGHYSKNDELYVTSYITSVQDIYDHVSCLHKVIDPIRDRNLANGVDIMPFPVFYTVACVKEAYEEARQRVVKSINEYFEKLVKVRVTGVGFYTDTLSDEKFVAFMRSHEKTLTSSSAPAELRDIYENVVVRHGKPSDFFVEDSDFDCKAVVIAHVMNNETTLCAGHDIFDGMFTNKDDDAWNRPCVSIADKEYARLHSEYGLEKKSVLDTIEKYAKELGLEYGSVSYYMMCDSKFADDIGEIVK